VWTKRPGLATAGLVLLAVFVLCAIFAPVLAPHDPAQLDLNARLLPPTHAHFFGTDELGRDIFSRVLFGARISLMVAVSVVAISLSVGLVMGALAGFYGGWLDAVINIYVMNAFLALPGILLAIAFVAFLGPGLSAEYCAAADRAGGYRHGGRGAGGGDAELPWPRHTAAGCELGQHAE